MEMLDKLKPVVIITCVDYWDFLKITLPHTLKFCSRAYVYTTPGNVPDSFAVPDGVEIVETDSFYRNGATFNKAAVINEAQHRLHARYPHAWMLLLDADIIVSPDSCREVEWTAPAGPADVLYGIQRKDYETPEAFEKDDYSIYHSPGAGYFQLYYDKLKYYPESSEDASVCDITFYTRFPRKETCDGYVVHLGQHTVNWKGRASAPWRTEPR